MKQNTGYCTVNSSIKPRITWEICEKPDGQNPKPQSKQTITLPPFCCFLVLAVFALHFHALPPFCCFLDLAVFALHFHALPPFCCFLVLAVFALHFHALPLFCCFWFLAFFVAQFHVLPPFCCFSFLTAVLTPLHAALACGFVSFPVVVHVLFLSFSVSALLS